MSEPQTEYLRYGVMRDWLRDDYGILECELLKLIGANIIRGHRHRPHSRCFYIKKDIVRDVLRRDESAGNNGITKLKKK